MAMRDDAKLPHTVAGRGSMKGSDFRAARERLGATHQQIAQATCLRTSQVVA
jgi:hypothetical protein